MKHVYIARARCTKADADVPPETIDFAFEAEDTEKVDLNYARLKVITFLRPLIGKTIDRVDVWNVRRSRNLVLIPPMI